MWTAFICFWREFSENGNGPLTSIKCRKYLDSWVTISFKSSLLQQPLNVERFCGPVSMEETRNIQNFDKEVLTCYYRKEDWGEDGKIILKWYWNCTDIGNVNWSELASSSSDSDTLFREELDQFCETEHGWLKWHKNYMNSFFPCKPLNSDC